jgi:large subunit ribosomal protein L18
MKEDTINKNRTRHKRALRVRSHLFGTAHKPRLCVVKSNKHLQAQLIDDEQGVTIAAASTYSKELRSAGMKKGKESARHIGKHLAEAALAKNIKTVIFDRGPFKYHGILAELADAARAAGLQF